MESYKKIVQPMDVIVVYNKTSFFHRLVAKVTKYRAGHVALYVGDGMICEAGGKGVIRRPWKNYSSNHKIFIGRYLGLTESQGLTMMRKCIQLEGDRYAYIQLIAILFQQVFGFSKIPDMSKRAMICSEKVAAVYKSAGLELKRGKRPHETTPADILNSEILHFQEASQ
jgi:hypothetical protein